MVSQRRCLQSDGALFCDQHFKNAYPGAGTPHFPWYIAEARRDGILLSEQVGIIDHQIGRFITADKTDILAATPEEPLYDINLFAYCDNNPVMRADTGGDFTYCCESRLRRS